MSANRPTDEQVALYAATVPTSIMDEAVLRMVSGDNAALVSLAIEVQARRKLVADLLALLGERDASYYGYDAEGYIRASTYESVRDEVLALIEADRG